MTPDQILELHPWMKDLEDKIQETCHDCKVELGERHLEGCDTARCSSCGCQRLTCTCESGEPDIWTGIMYPDLHKKCFENDLWCKDLMLYKGEYYDIPRNSYMQRLSMALHMSRELSMGTYVIIVNDNNTLNFKRISKTPGLSADEIWEIDCPSMEKFAKHLIDDPSPKVRIKFHIPCEKTEIGAHEDLNRASQFGE